MLAFGCCYNRGWIWWLVASGDLRFIEAGSLSQLELFKKMERHGVFSKVIDPHPNQIKTDVEDDGRDRQRKWENSVK